jgi:hypothetical protein
LAEAGERERVVAHGADVMLGLPDSPAFDARARVEGSFGGTVGSSSTGRSNDQEAVDRFIG